MHNMNDAIKCGMVAALAGLAGCGDVNAAQEAKNAPAPKTSCKETVVSNADGSVTRTRTETKEFKDEAGNVIGHETSTYTETTFEGDKPAAKEGEKEGGKPADAKKDDAADSSRPAAPVVATDAFLGLKFGETVPGADKAEDVPGEPALKAVKFTPAKKLAGFDDYYAYVTPKTHKLVKVCACAKEAVDGGTFGRRHYLVEALEKRYRTWARLASFTLPYYVFDVGPDRGVSICLVSASDDYETVITAWDDAAARLARDEYRELRDAAYRQAVERRNSRVQEAASAF